MFKCSHESIKFVLLEIFFISELKVSFQFPKTFGKQKSEILFEKHMWWIFNLDTFDSPHIKLSHRYGPGEGSDENGTIDVIKSKWDKQEANPIRVTAKIKLRNCWFVDQSILCVHYCVWCKKQKIKRNKFKENHSEGAFQFSFSFFLPKKS